MKERMIASVALSLVTLLAVSSPAAEYSMGSAEAVVTMVEYSSLSCPHCARFHKETLPHLKERYIDTGQVRLIYRHFPLNQISHQAALLAECIPKRRYFRFIDYLFEHQQYWSRSVARLKRMGQLAGLSAERVDSCLNDDHLAEQIEREKQQAIQQFGVSSTPTFIFNGRYEIKGARSVEAFEQMIDGLLGEATRSLPQPEIRVRSPGREVDDDDYHRRYGGDYHRRYSDDGYHRRYGDDDYRKHGGDDYYR